MESKGRGVGDAPVEPGHDACGVARPRYVPFDFPSLARFSKMRRSVLQ
jgi:hypothetical protein